MPHSMAVKSTGYGAYEGLLSLAPTASLSRLRNATEPHCVSASLLVKQVKEYECVRHS